MDPETSPEYAWLWDVEHGVSIEEVSSRAHLSPRRIRQGLSWARGALSGVGDTTAVVRIPPRLPHLEPISPIESLTPMSACPHYGPIRLGSCIYCIVCSQSGQDEHPLLQRSPYTDPKREPEPPPVRKPAPHVETRRERRLRIYGARPLTEEPKVA